MNEESFALELQNTFLSEAQEMLEETETAFIQIEADPTDSAKIDKIFRLVHTIKGSAHVAGFSDLGAFAHSFETLLGSLRERKLAVTSTIIDVLLAGNDCLKKYVSALNEDKSAKISVSEVEHRIAECLPESAQRLPNIDPIPKSFEAAVEAPLTANAIEKCSQLNKNREQAQTPIFLICDDEPNILILLEEILVEGGYTVISADNAVKALEIFHSQHIDVIFTDLKMPEMDGIEFVSAVRSSNEFIPIVFLSAHSSRENFKDYLKLRVDSFVEKPFAANEVLAVASRAVRERHLRESILSLSRLSFKAFVSIEKILALTTQTEASLLEKDRLDAFMQDIRDATTKLLAAERALKR